jgi:hypothetical protein
MVEAPDIASQQSCRHAALAFDHPSKPVAGRRELQKRRPADLPLPEDPPASFFDRRPAGAGSTKGSI